MNFDKQIKNITLVTHPFKFEAGNVILTRITRVFLECSDKVTVITSENFKYTHKNLSIIKIKNPDVDSLFLKIFKQLIIQLSIISNIRKFSNDIDMVFFYIGSGTYFLPNAYCRLKDIDTYIITGEDLSTIVLTEKRNSTKIILNKVFYLLERINFILAKNIITQSQNLVFQLNIQSQKRKIIVLNELFIDTDQFKDYNNYQDRFYSMGFIGRLSYEKGIVQFLEAAKLLSKKNPKFNIIIGGDGPLKNYVITYINENQLSNINYIGWIPQQKLTEILNSIKLLIIPSLTELGPYIAIEAMACGTPILISKVGSVQEYIKDGHNGFLLNSNAPNEIVRKVLSIENSQLENVTNNCRSLIEKQFTFNSVVRKYKQIFLRGIIDEH